MVFSRRSIGEFGIKATVLAPFWMRGRLAWAFEPEKAELVVIDPGHGGHDPGCIGAGNVFEKNIVLDAAWDLNRVLRRAGYRTAMTREHDVFISLSDRVEFAERHRASLFVSVHANAVVAQPGIRGASVYTFSPDPSDPLAAEIARDENGVEAAATPAFKNVSPDVAKILFGLMRRSTKAESVLAQQKMVAALSRHVGMLPNPARKATFAVLQSAAIPSILVETAFLSNAQDEAALRTPAFRGRLAIAMASAVEAWFLARQAGVADI